ncbi:MAG: stage V sporulation protein D, partial [Firmicutes bacterium]|nr:stage V sporulation protein D [Bacillota bacterium]
MCIRVGWVQIVKGEEYSKKAIEQQTKDTPVAAKRGTIYDRNMTKLAVSAPCYSIWARPAEVALGLKGTEKDVKIEETASALADILEMDKDEVKEFLTADKTLIKITKYRDRETADKVREAGLDGIEVAEDVKRHYPLKEFCAHVLGSVTDNNTGLSGIEMEYNNYLSGTAGRSIKDTAADGRTLTYGSEHYYAPENGTGLQLTIDEVMQHYLEKSIKKAYKKNSADNVMGIIMDPKTGEILAMGSYPDFDPNNAKEPLKKKD